MITGNAFIQREDLIKLCNIAFIAGCNSYHDLAEFKSEEIVDKFYQDKLFSPCSEEQKSIEQVIINNDKDAYFKSLKDALSLKLKNKLFSDNDECVKPVDFFHEAEKINNTKYTGILNSSHLSPNFVTISSNEISKGDMNIANTFMNSLDSMKIEINPCFEGSILTITSSKDNN